MFVRSKARMVFSWTLVASVLFLVAAPRAALADSCVEVIADSQVDFSGVQGGSGWQYGYYKPFIAHSAFDFSDAQGGGGWQYGYYATAGVPSSFSTADMVYDTDRFPTPKWSLDFAGFHLLGTLTSHPGVVSVVRRWTSDFAGSVEIRGRLQKADPRGGDGVIGRIYHNGSEIYTQVLDFDDTLGFIVSLAATIAVGDTIDFAVDPIGNNNFDSTVFFAGISDADGPSIPSSFGTAGMVYDTDPDRFPTPHWSLDFDPFHLLGSDTFHPNVVCVVRRWTSDFAGSVEIRGRLHKNDPRGGNGVIGRIYHNGSEIYTQVLDFDDTVGFTVSLAATIAVGDTIDFAVDPIGYSNFDSTSFHGQVEIAIPGCNEPPEITCIDPVVLWSPDHELVDVSSAISVSDPDGDPVTLTFRVFSDETETPDTGDGTGRHAPDFKTELASGAQGVFVRSERRGREDGRFYIGVITADDGNGGVTTKVCTLAVVPHDQNDPASLDSVLAQAATAAALVQAAVDSAGALPPTGMNEHGLSETLGPHQ